MPDMANLPRGKFFAMAMARGVHGTAGVPSFLIFLGGLPSGYVKIAIENGHL